MIPIDSHSAQRTRRSELLRGSPLRMSEVSLGRPDHCLLEINEEFVMGFRSLPLSSADQVVNDEAVHDRHICETQRQRLVILLIPS